MKADAKKKKQTILSEDFLYSIIFQKEAKHLFHFITFPRFSRYFLFFFSYLFREIFIWFTQT